MKILSRQEAAKELYNAILEMEGNLSLSYNTVYRMILRNGDVWRLASSANNSHDYTACPKTIIFD